MRHIAPPVSALAAAAALVALASPAFAQITLAPGFQPTPWQGSGAITGTIDASGRGPGCIGQMTAEPLYQVTLTQAFSQLTFDVDATIDATLLVEGPDGTVWCNDDFNGTNPRVQGAFAAGEYGVWIGTYHGDHGGYTLSISEAGVATGMGAQGSPVPPIQEAPADPTATDLVPNPPAGDVAPQPTIALLQLPITAAGVPTLGFGPGSQPDPATTSVTAGGTQMGDAVRPGCVGFIGTRPSATLALTGDMSWMRITAVSETDVTLVVVDDRGGVWCDDDTHGFNPEVSGPMTAGTYGVYVGTYGGSGTAPATVEVSAAPRPAGAVTPTPPPTANGDWRPIAPGFLPDPMSAAGTSGGAVDATPRGATASGPCRGSIPAVPQHTLVLEQAFANLTVSVDAPGDTTLVIEGPNGELRCNDDRNRFNPAVDGAWPAGTWRVFVGAYGQPGPYTLSVTEY